ncbi:hypothetical protein I4U23_008556 [Adineta vaga]|nr:hypothetical protein I4U23_008556 [Adineta vaga]
MLGNCSVETCERLQHALCHGCKLSFCREHMFEHSLSTHLQLNPLIDQVNQIQDQLKGIDKLAILRLPFEKLEDWRQKAHQAIDAYCADKVKELDAYVVEMIKQHEQELLNIRTRIMTSMREQDTTHELVQLLTFKIQSLQNDINRLLQSNIQLQINPLVIDKNLITYEQLFNILNVSPAYRIIQRSRGSFTSLATDNEFLLLHHQDSLLLVDELLTTYKKCSMDTWTYL